MQLWTCARADLRRAGAGLLLLVAIAGIAGGATLAAVAAARRTETSYLRLIEAEDPGDVFMFGQGELDDADLDELRAIPGARVGASTIVILSSAHSGIDRGSDFGVIVALDAESLEHNRPHHLKGRMPSPQHPEEIVVNERVARDLDVAPGDSVELVGPTEAGFECLDTLECDGSLVAPPIVATVSGVSRRADDLDPDAFNGALTFAGPEFVQLVPPEYLRAVTVVDVDLDRGAAGVDDFTEAVNARWPDRFGIEPFDAADTDLTGTLDLEARSLLVFAFFAGVGGLVASVQAFARHLSGGAPERRILAALGLTAPARFGVVLIGGLIIAGGAAVVAMVVASAASAFLPVGIAGQLEPQPGVDFDELALVGGALAMFTIIGASFAATAWWAVRHDAADRGASFRHAGRLRPVLPVVPAVGFDLAAPRLRRPGWGSTVGAMTGLALAVATAVGAAVITASNDGLQRHPERYGQPWDAIVSTSPDTATRLASQLAAEPDVVALALAASGETELSAGPGPAIQAYAVGFELLDGAMEPTILAGRAPRTKTEVALGSDLLDALGVRIGDEVTTASGASVEVVGRASIPIVGGDFPDDGALFTREGFAEHATDVQGEDAEVGVAFDVPDDADLDALLAGDLGQAVALAGVPARTPSRVTTLAGIGRFPGAVALFTGALALTALLHALLVVVRGRRRDLATLRALGLRRAQSQATVLWAALVLLVVGLTVGVPLGIVLGRLIWRATTSTIHVVFIPTVPGGILVVITALAAVGAASAAAWPLWRVRQLRVGEVLRTE